MSVQRVLVSRIRTGCKSGQMGDLERGWRRRGQMKGAPCGQPVANVCDQGMWPLRLLGAARVP